MLKSSNRIKQSEFQSLFKSGRSTQNLLFTLIFGLKTPEITTNGPLCTVVVSKNVSKKAVERNKIRRRIYAILKKNEKALQNKGFYIFLVKKPAQKASFQEIEQAVTSVILK
jgi:ribonuclease P protein component